MQFLELLLAGSKRLYEGVYAGPVEFGTKLLRARKADDGMIQAAIRQVTELRYSRYKEQGGCRNMRWDRLLLRSGYAGSAGLAAGTYLLGFAWTISIGVFLGSVALTRAAVYLYFERHLAFKTFEDFRSEKIRHECIACGASCHLRVSLGKDDVERILNYAKETGIQETVIEKKGNTYWLKRRPTGACVFLTYSGKIPRCSIYPIRPTACRLYPLIPSGNRLKVDPFCPGLSKNRGQTFKRHLITQDVGTYVRKVMGKI